MTNTRLRRFLNQAVIDHKICTDITCVGTKAVCSFSLDKSKSIPCHIWKRTKLRHLLHKRK